MAEIYQRPTKEVEVQGETFVITALPALKALDLQMKLTNGADGATIRDAIIQSVTKDNMAIDAKKFDTMFSGKIAMVMKLFSEIMEFNFHDPLGESDSDLS